MKIRRFSLHLTILCVLTLSLNSAFSGTKSDIEVSEKSAEKSTVKDGRSIAQETWVNYSYVGATDVKQGNARIGNVDQQTFGAHYVVSPEIKDGLLFRAGVEWNRHSFGLPDAAPLPNTLQDIGIIVGIDAQIGDDWLLRVEAQPGIYSDFVDISGRDFNMPVVVAATYLLNKDVQWVFALSANINRGIPIIPAAGLRWKFADKWVLNLIPPRLRLEYELDKSIQLYGGFDIRGGTYMVNDNFGNNHGRTNLNRTPMDYWEVRTGGGLGWKVFPGVKLEAEAGAQVLRNYSFHRANTTITNNDPAPYVQIAVNGNF